MPLEWAAVITVRVVTSAPVGTPAARTLLAGVVCGADISSICTIIWDFVLLRINTKCVVRLVVVSMFVVSVVV